MAPQAHYCVCAQLLLSSSTPLASVPRRKGDKAIILPLPAEPASLTSQEDLHYALLARPLDDYMFTRSGEEGPEVIVAVDDGFEKRSLLRCGRCKVIWGYALHQPGTGRSEDAVYLYDDVLE